MDNETDGWSRDAFSYWPERREHIVSYQEQCCVKTHQYSRSILSRKVTSASWALELATSIHRRIYLFGCGSGQWYLYHLSTFIWQVRLNYKLITFNLHILNKLTRKAGNRPIPSPGVGHCFRVLWVPPFAALHCPSLPFDYGPPFAFSPSFGFGPPSAALWFWPTLRFWPALCSPFGFQAPFSKWHNTFLLLAT